MKILILASNPRKDLNLDDEIRLLRSVIDQSRDRDQFEIVSALGVRVGDLQRLLLQHKPQIVHFCGHGSGEEGLIFKMDGGGEQSVRADALANMFGLNPICSHVKCVLLNACYSETQADAIVSRINYVVGMSHAIQDNAAIAFSKGFYLGLGEGCSIDDSFEFGRNAIQLEISGSSKTRSAATEEGVRQAKVVDVIQQTLIPEHLKPILKYNPALTQASNRAFSVSEQPLSQAKREEIQRNVAKAVTEEKPELKQFRDQIREYLQDHQLADHEIVFLDQLREELGLSTEEVDGVLEDEQAPIRQAQRAYEKRLVALIKYYPFSNVIQEELKKFQVQRKLTDEEVNKISRPILEQAEAAYQAKLRQQAQQEYENQLQQYEQEFSRAIATSYPIESPVREELEGVQQSLKLSDEDITQIEQPILVIKEAEYQQQLADEQRKREEAEQQRRVDEECQKKLKQQEAQQAQQEYEQKLQQYEQEFSQAIATSYPIESPVRDQLKGVQQSLELSDEEVTEIEQPIVAIKEAEYHQRLADEQRKREEAEQQRRADEEYQQRLVDEECQKKLKQQEAQQAQQEYEQKLQRYEQEFRMVMIAAQYPFDPFVRDGLTKFQQSLGLSDEDVARIEKPIVALKEAAYQQRLAEEQHSREAAERQRELEQQQELERQWQERLKREATEKQRQAEEEEEQRRQAEQLRQQQAAEAEAEAARLKQQEQLKREADKNRQEQAKQPLSDPLKGNYAQLEALLKAGEWKAADQETNKQMCQVMERQQEGWLDFKDIEQFPCADLREIDRLWVKYSNGKFGFSVQKQIWQECGSPVLNATWRQFGERVGWRKGFLGLGKWCQRSDLRFDTSAPDGHLPAFLAFDCGDEGWIYLKFITIFLRTDL